MSAIWSLRADFDLWIAHRDHRAKNLSLRAWPTTQAPMITTTTAPPLGGVARRRSEQSQGDDRALAGRPLDHDQPTPLQVAQHPPFDFFAHAPLLQSSVRQRESRAPGLP